MRRNNKYFLRKRILVIILFSVFASSYANATITGPSIVCCGSSTTYWVTCSQGTISDITWSVTGGTINNWNDLPTVSITWNSWQGNPTGTITVNYSCNGYSNSDDLTVNFYHITTPTLSPAIYNVECGQPDTFYLSIATNEYVDNVSVTTPSNWSSRFNQKYTNANGVIYEYRISNTTGLGSGNVCVTLTNDCNENVQSCMTISRYCENNITLCCTNNLPAFSSANAQIYSYNATVENGDNVLFRSNGTIQLGTGFTAVSGSSFIAELGTCCYQTTKISNYNAECEIYSTNQLFDTCLQLENSFFNNKHKMLIIDNEYISIIPNPTKSKFIINISDYKYGTFNVDIIDMAGIIIKSIINTNSFQPISVEGILAGRYIIRVYNNDFLETKNLIIE